MAEKKRQHYVPQFYLKYFSKDEKTIAVFSIEEQKLLTTKAPIDRQSYENYMYSKDLKYENGLAEIEGVAENSIGDIIKTKIVPRKKDENYYVLLVFVTYQFYRTMGAVDELNEMYSKLTKAVLKANINYFEGKNITIEKIEKMEINKKEPGTHNLVMASMDFRTLYDLQCKIIINNNQSKDFVTSDNPVVLYNKYYLNHERSHFGLACKGILLILPISPKMILIFYDPVIYKVGGQKFHTPVCQVTDSDIDNLNVLQMINAREVVYTKYNNEYYLKKLSEIANKYRSSEKATLNEYNVVNENKDRGILFALNRNKQKYSLNLSFLKINKKIPEYYKRQILVRDPIFISLYREFYEKVMKKELKNSEWDKFIKSKMS